MTSGKNETGKKNNLTLTGDLSISRAANILSLLKESLQEGDEVRIILHEISRVDLSCLQLLCSAHRTAATAGKVLTLAEPVPDLFRQLIRQTGFKRHKACALCSDTNCLCFDGGESWQDLS